MVARSLDTLREECVFKAAVAGEDAEAALLQPAPAPPLGLRRSKLAAAVSLAALLAVAAALALGPGRALVSRHAAAAVTLLDEQVCAGEGSDCHAGKCCLDGGKGGLQCYAKNEFWAECADSCTKGVHDGETRGSYGADGQFHLDAWSCEELGSRSKSGCDVHENEAACPKEKCTWKGSCTTACPILASSQSCWANPKCMWKDQCMEACSSFDSQDTCLPTSKCIWQDDKCLEGCWTFNSAETCPGANGCMWDGTCTKDPCSAPGEGCAQTKCCSAARGGSGTTCFQKDATWSSCLATCGDGDSKDWSCKALGKRTNYSAGCAWAGKSCATEHVCCNIGFACAKKDESWTACVQTEQKSTWMTLHVPLPEGWDGTIVGGGRSEYQIQAAGPNEAKLGTSLYCFMAILPDSYEVELMSVAQNNKASIFGCDANDVFHSWQSSMAGWDTGTSTLTNTDVFINVWQNVQNMGTYAKYDWTVKADADAVLVPDRLRQHLAGLNAPAYRAIYIKNNGMDPGLGNNGFLGAVEVFSKLAVDVYFDNQEGCHQSLGVNAGEDGYFKGCMDALGVGFMWDMDLFFPDHSSGACAQTQRAAFHPLKSPGEWQHCWDIVTGKVPW